MPTNTATAWSAFGTAKARAARYSLGRAAPAAAARAGDPLGALAAAGEPVYTAAESAAGTVRQPLPPRPRRLGCDGDFPLVRRRRLAYGNRRIVADLFDIGDTLLTLAGGSC